MEIGHSEKAESRICSDCINSDNLIRYEIVSIGREGRCSYCNKSSQRYTLSFSEVCHYINQKIIQYYYADHRVHGDFDPVSIISQKASIDKNVATDVWREIKSGYSEDGLWLKKHDLFVWDDFVKHLKKQSRYFSLQTSRQLANYFESVSNCIEMIGPNYEIRKLYRARLFESDNRDFRKALEYPWQFLGPPPHEFASPGRMNPRGISIFYGALEPETAYHEVRPFVGSRVAVACFTIEKPLQILDINKLLESEPERSIFDYDYDKSYERNSFIRSFRDAVSQPVAPGREDLGYLPTQVIAEFLANSMRLDGVKYPSVQAGEHQFNVVLFHNASRVYQEKDSEEYTFKLSDDSFGSNASRFHVYKRHSGDSLLPSNLKQRRR